MACEGSGVGSRGWYPCRMHRCRSRCGERQEQAEVGGASLVVSRRPPLRRMVEYHCDGAQQLRFYRVIRPTIERMARDGVRIYPP